MIHHLPAKEIYLQKDEHLRHVGFHLKSFFHYFLGLLQWFFSQLMQCKQLPVRPPLSDIGTILRLPRIIFKNIPPPNIPMELPLADSW